MLQVVDEKFGDGPSPLNGFLQDIRAAAELLAQASHKVPDAGFADPEKVQAALLVAAAKTSLAAVVAAEDYRDRLKAHAVRDETVGHETVNDETPPAKPV